MAAATRAIASTSRSRCSATALRWQQADSGQAIAWYRNTLQALADPGRRHRRSDAHGPRGVDRSADSVHHADLRRHAGRADPAHTGRGSVLHRRQSRRRPDHVRRSAGRAAGRRPRDRRRLRRRRRRTSSTAQIFNAVHARPRRPQRRRRARGLPDGAEHHAHPRARGRPRASASATPTRARTTSCIPRAARRGCRCRRRSGRTTSPGSCSSIRRCSLHLHARAADVDRRRRRPAVRQPCG